MERNPEQSYHKDLNKIICNAKSMDQLINIYHSRLSDLNSVNVSTMIHRVAKLSKYSLVDDDFVSILAKEVNCQAKSFNCQGISNILWAFATLNNVEVFDILSEEVIYKVKHFTCKI